MGWRHTTDPREILAAAYEGVVVSLLEALVALVAVGVRVECSPRLSGRVVHVGLPGGIETLEEARARARAELALLPEALRRLEPAEPYAVRVSDALRKLADEVDRTQTATT